MVVKVVKVVMATTGDGRIRCLRFDPALTSTALASSESHITRCLEGHWKGTETNGMVKKRYVSSCSILSKFRIAMTSMTRIKRLVIKTTTLPL